MLLMFGAANAQIGDVQQKGNWLHSYDGNREIGRFAIGSSDEFLGFSSSIVVVKKGNWIHSYDQKGIELGRFAIGSSDQFRSVVLQSFVDIKVKYLIYTLTLHRVFFL